MRKIKLVVSDLHISKGKFLEDGSPNLLEDFVYDREFMDFLGWFRSDEFRKYDVELIFNGDFLNTLQVDLSEQFPEIITEKIALEKVRSILKGHAELFEALRDFANTPKHAVTVIPGNHDPAFMWPAVRDYFGAYMRSEVRFPIPSYRFDGFHVEHGNQHSAINAFEAGNYYINRHDDEPILNLPWGGLFVIKFLNRIKMRRGFADKVRPLRRYLLMTLVNDPLFGWPAVFKLITFFISSRFKPVMLNKGDLSKTLRILFEGMQFLPDLEGAARKILFSQPGVHTVLMGHSHVTAHRRFRADKEYLNTGSWNDTIHLDIENLGRHRKLTFALIDYRDEGRPRARLFEWKGIARPFVPVEY